VGILKSVILEAGVFAYLHSLGYRHYELEFLCIHIRETEKLFPKRNVTLQKGLVKLCPEGRILLIIVFSAFHYSKHSTHLRHR
jgi:hypothetical protein